MAQAMTVSVDREELYIESCMQSLISKVTLDWQSDSSGDCDQTTTKSFSGKIVRVVFIPDSGGTQPTDQYDIDVKDDTGLDVLISVGDNLSNTTTTQTCPVISTYFPLVIANTTLNLVVANAGDTKGGQVILYIV